MSLKLDTELDLTPSVNSRYLISSHHRQKIAKKSIWTISKKQEVECFITTIKSNWKEDFVSWGIIHDGNSIQQIGINPNNETLKFAKFVDSKNNDLWHGYPADYVRNHQDRPGMAILQDWRTKKFIEKHHILKIRQGKECNL